MKIRTLVQGAEDHRFHPPSIYLPDTIQAIIPPTREEL